jgi:hypothetical protein
MRKSGEIAALVLALAIYGCGKGLDTSPEWLNGDRFFLYAALFGTNNLAAFEMDPRDGTLAPRGTFSPAPALVGPTYVRRSPGGTQLLAAYTGGSITQQGSVLCGIGPDGALRYESTYKTSGHVTVVADFSPTLNAFYTYEYDGVNSHRITRVNYDPASGSSASAASLAVLSASNTPYNMRVHPTGNYLYLGLASNFAMVVPLPSGDPASVSTSLAASSSARDFAFSNAYLYAGFVGSGNPGSFTAYTLRTEITLRWPP